MAYFSPRDAETTLSCPDCGARMHIRRSCLEAHLACPACKKEYPLKDYIGQADAAMEKFLENLYIDRI